MPSNDLDQAIELIQQGQPEQAQPILQALIRANPQDLAAWSWYVKSCSTPEQRLKALEACLQFNPGNPQVLDAIQKVRAKLSATQPPAVFTPPAVQTPVASTMDTYAATTLAIPSINSAVEAVDAPREFIGLDESPGRPFIWYEVWWTALTQPKVETYTALLRDPLAGQGRVYWWIFLAGMVTGLVSLMNPSLMVAVNQFEQIEGAANFSTMIAIALVVLVPVGAIFSVLGTIVGAAIYNLLAKLFGGTGNFSRTVYLMGAYTAPFSIITGILSVIPLINCLGIVMAFYSFKLSVTAIQSAHRLNGGRSFIVVMIPTLIILMLFFIALIVGWQTLMQTLRSYYGR